MDNKQCIGLDKFYQCLSVMFPSNSNDGDGKNTSSNPSKDHEEGRTKGKIPVKFTKNAVELLRESLTVFLRKVGRDLVEEIEEGDSMSQQSIRPEDVAKILLSFDDDNDDDERSSAVIATKEGNSKNEGMETTASSMSTNSLPEMKEVVRQAQELLLKRKNLESEESKSRSRKRKHTEARNDSEDPGGPKDVFSVATSSNATSAASSTRQQKRKGKRKKQKLKITAEMEAEQERLLQASKLALESSKKDKGDGGNPASFSVVLS